MVQEIVFFEVSEFVFSVPENSEKPVPTGPDYSSDATDLKALHGAAVTVSMNSPLLSLILLTYNIIEMTTAIDTEKHKGGRPPKEKDELRPKKVKVGFTNLEFDTVTYKANNAGRRPAYYIHDAALSANVPSHINDEQIDLVRNFAKMGNNVNQIAHQANLGKLPAIENECHQVLGLIGTLITRIVRGGDLSR